jgi:hypothetical protein
LESRIELDFYTGEMMGGTDGARLTREFSGLDSTLDRFSVERDAPRLAAEVLTSIRTLGYAHITELLTAEDFDLVAQALGSIALRTDLAITQDRSSIVYKPDEIAFHQDNPAMSILGWYCVRQDEFDGSARLIDVGDVAERFLQDELETMTSINVKYPDPDPLRHNPDKGLVAHLLWPLVTLKATRCEVYYVPWLMLDSYNEEQSRVIEKFSAYVRAKEETQVIRIRLKEGESLFIDNNRMLHGRGPMRQDSKRFLKRVWIKRDS